MANKPSEPNRLLKLRKSIAAMQKDICFLNLCLENKVTPPSHRIKPKAVISNNTIRKLERDLIKESIKNLYTKLESTTRLAYHLHLKLARQYPTGFDAFFTKVKVAENCESERKRKLHAKKLKLLTSRWSAPPKAIVTVEPLNNFVVNRSSEAFNEDHLDLLNKGLKYAIASSPDIEQTIIDVEAGIATHSLPTQQANAVRSSTAEILKALPNQRADNKERDIIKELRDKPVYYVKADKGNALVIMNKDDYDSAMQSKLDNGPYRAQRIDPLPNMIKNVDSAIKTHAPILGEELKRMKVSNPSLPRIKGLPKIHKPGCEMREIVAAEDAPTQKLAKWLVQEFRNMPKQAPGRSVKNSAAFTTLLQASGGISDDEIMVSFDVTALYPSIPIGETMDILEDWLHTQRSGSDWKYKVRSYIKLTRTCMDESYFMFRGKFYKQLKGAPMGNPLSSTLSDIFMNHLETKLHQQGLLPERWWRYVDDVFSIVKRNELPKILEVLNNSHRNIRFTHETENEGKLSFLDILVIRESGSFSFEIYRKPTNTMRVIPSTSNHSYQHKMAAFHHMIHRMESIPLSPEGQNKETELIFEIARVNGYHRTTIQAIIDKKKRNRFFASLTTLTPDRAEPKRVCMEFNHNVSIPLKEKLRRVDIEVVHSSRMNQLCSLLGSTKDPVEKHRKSGVYEVKCPHCEMTYIGQTKRMLETRLKEHMAEVNKAKKECNNGKNHHFRSKVAEHFFTKDHTITTEDARIIRHITNPWKLDVAESIEIYKRPTTTLLNADVGNGSSWLFKLIPTYNNSKKRAQHIPEILHTSKHT